MTIELNYPLIVLLTRPFPECIQWSATSNFYMSDRVQYDPAADMRVAVGNRSDCRNWKNWCALGKELLLRDSRTCVTNDIGDASWRTCILTRKGGNDIWKVMKRWGYNYIARYTEEQEATNLQARNFTSEAVSERKKGPQQGSDPKPDPPAPELQSMGMALLSR
ncbi:hypothetical protein HDU85_000511 [Gaertneriomyces sp. JEL0708]|nr:hypothetical protein HDU85_000511 [Gaertneriomyces sp. JEL0708]